MKGRGGRYRSRFTKIAGRREIGGGILVPCWSAGERSRQACMVRKGGGGGVRASLCGGDTGYFEAHRVGKGGGVGREMFEGGG